MLPVPQLKKTEHVIGLTKKIQSQGEANLKQILACRNTTLCAGDTELVQLKTPLCTHYWVLEIVQKGPKCDVVLEMWAFQLILKNYTNDTDLVKNQSNPGRSDILRNALTWTGRILPCYSENISLTKNDQKLFEAKFRAYNRKEQTERPKLGLYECERENCPDCVAKGRKCTLSTKGLQPSSKTEDSEFPDYFLAYSQNSNNQVSHMRVGELRGETGHYRVEVVYFNDKIHNEMIGYVTSKVTFAINNKSESIIINDYSPGKRARATITHSPNSPSISPLRSADHIRNAPVNRTTSLPLGTNNSLKPSPNSDHGKSAPVNINGEQGSSNSFTKEVNSSANKYSFSFDKEVNELLATSPQSSISQQIDAPLWKKSEKNFDEDPQPGSPRKFEKRRSGRRKSSGKSSVMSSGDENQFAFDSETLKPKGERASFLCDPEFEDI
jgi:hypothetical protein